MELSRAGTDGKLTSGCTRATDHASIEAVPFSESVSLSPGCWLVAMPDLAKLESELIVGYPAPWVRHHLATFPEGYFEAFDETAIGRHIGAMMELTDTRSVRVLAEAEGEDVWRIDVVGYDAFQFLSTLCTLLAVRGLAILEGQVFTSQCIGPAVVRSSARRGPQPRRLHRRETL